MAHRSGLDPLTAHSLVGDETITEDAFKIIDEEMKRHSDFILSLKTRRNTFSPISRLPPELLSRIFGFVRENRFEHIPSWINVSYVCRTWRSVALNFPSLWTNLPLTHRRWTAEMLSRSKNASLTVEADCASNMYYQMPDSRVSEAFLHSSRIRHLTLSNFDLHRMKKFLSIMPRHAPRLETLCLSVHLRDYDNPLDLTDCGELPSELLTTADRLRHFEVVRVKFNWDSIISESLTRFKVHDGLNSVRPTMSQFWTVLKKMPFLESLELVNALPGPFKSEHDNLSRETIHFAHLQSLTLTLSTPEVENFLQHVSCPPTATIIIDCKGTAVTSGLHDFSGLFSWISSTLSPTKKSRGSNIRSVAIQTPTLAGGLRIKAFPDVLTDLQLQSDTFPKLDLSLRCPTNIEIRTEDVVNKLLADVFGAVSLQGLVSLRLDHGGSSLSAHTLTETFGTLPQLRSVYVVGPLAVNLVKALNETLPSKRSTRSNHAQRPSFPALRSLSLNNVDLEYDLSLDTLRDVIKARKKRGAEIRELKLQMCSRITLDNAGELEDIVPKFIWDKVELGYSDEEYFSDGYGYGGYDESDIEYEDYYDVFGFPF